MLIVRATQDMAKDTELLITYQAKLDEDESYDVRKKKLRGWNFECTCSCCEDSKSYSNELIAKRSSLKARFDEFNKEVDPYKVETAAFMKHLDVLTSRLASTYNPATLGSVPRRGLAQMYICLSRRCSDIMKSRRTIRAARKALEALGFTVTGMDPADKADGELKVEKWGLVVEHLVRAWVAAWTAFAELKNLKKAAVAGRYAKLTYKIVVGEDETFDKVYGKHATDAISEGTLWAGHDVYN